MVKFRELNKYKRTLNTRAYILKNYNLLKIVLKEKQKEKKLIFVIANDAVYDDLFSHGIRSIKRLTFYYIHPRNDYIIHVRICMNDTHGTKKKVKNER